MLKWLSKYLFQSFSGGGPVDPLSPILSGSTADPSPLCASNFKTIMNYTTFMIRVVNSGVEDGNSILV
jgi:hypothetical protein